MTEISPSLLLSDAAQPANGVTVANPKAWYGGDLSLIASGNFAGASVQLVMTVKMPPSGKVPTTPTDWMQDADWIPLGDPITAPGRVDFGNINPCMLAIKVSSSAAGTRIKALLA